MIAYNLDICYKKQSRKNVGFLTASNQNEVVARMTEFPYTSIIWLTQGKYTIVDNEDYEYLNQFKWYYRIGYARRSVGKKTLMLHRLLLDAPEGYEIDHINRVRNDNRRSNLRICTHAENMRNRSFHKQKNEHVGVVQRKSGRWYSYIHLGKRQINLGTHDTQEEARAAYCKASEKYRGEIIVNEQLDKS